MKTEAQIKEKLIECESFVTKAINDKNNSLCEWGHLSGSRDALRWVLAEDLLKHDKMDDAIDFEIAVIESSQIF